MSKVNFNDGFFGTLGKSPAMEALIRSKAQPILAAAQRTAPVKTGRYRGSMRLNKRYSKYRVVIEVVATDRKSLLIESKRGILARALRSAPRG